MSNKISSHIVKPTTSSKSCIMDLPKPFVSCYYPELLGGIYISK